MILTYWSNDNLPWMLHNEVHFYWLNQGADGPDPHSGIS